MKVIADYVWIDGDMNLRSKTRVLEVQEWRNSLDDIPKWNYDGSSTNQAKGHYSEIILQPRRIFDCPFTDRIGDDMTGIIVMCDTYTPKGEPTTTNNRLKSKEIFDRHKDQKPWYGLEQEYFIFDSATNRPLYFDDCTKQGKYYCSVGNMNAFGRDVSDLHLKYCLKSGIKISGTNAEVAPAQWEYQIGPVEGIDVCDQLWISRYILEKITESHHCYIVWHPKPLEGDWNGSGCHVNFSTERMRNENGLQQIYDAIIKLEHRHNEHMEVYGKDNDKRMTGAHETARFDSFTWGEGNRGASIRIGSDTVTDRCGYFEDRRPASNIDPYLVCSKILETCML